jgi:hypothetical protein
MKRITKVTRLIILNSMVMCSCISLHAQFLSHVNEENAQVKLSGYIIGQYQATDNKESINDGGFSVKQARVSMDGKLLKDFAFKFQVEASKSTKSVNSDKNVKLLDAFVEWRKYTEAKIKIGEFHRCFTFENPYNPWDVGFDDNAQVVSYLVGGRDLGIQVQGDLFPDKQSKRFLGYQVGVFNGQGMNFTDKDKQRDIMGGIYIQPINKWFLGFYKWKGSYVTDDDIKQNRDRWSVGLKYESDWTFRSEYVSSKGKNTEPTDGWYATIGVPVMKGLKIYGKWDVIRENKQSEKASSVYEISANYYLCRNMKIQLDYGFHHKGESLTGDKDYNILIANLYYKF